MSDSNWPEPTPEPGEPPRVLAWLAYAAIAAGALFLISLGANSRLPQFNMPRIAMPDIDLRGRSESLPQQAPPEDYASSAADAVFPDGSGETVQTVPFETCVQMIADLSNSMSAEPAIIEDTRDRRVARFKQVEGSLTLTCSRADNTLTLEQGS